MLLFFRVKRLNIKQPAKFIALFFIQLLVYMKYYANPTGNDSHLSQLRTNAQNAVNTQSFWSENCCGSPAVWSNACVFCIAEHKNRFENRHVNVRSVCQMCPAEFCKDTITGNDSWCWHEACAISFHLRFRLFCTRSAQAATASWTTSRAIFVN